MFPKICGVFPPRHDVDKNYYDETGEFSSCLRKPGHADEHVFRKNDETYISWMDEQECVGTDRMISDDGACTIIFWSLDPEIAEKLLVNVTPIS